MVTGSKIPKPICLQGMGILTPLLMVDFLGDINLSFGMVMILTISQKSPETVTIMVTIDTGDGKTIYAISESHLIEYLRSRETTDPCILFFVTFQLAFVTSVFLN
jgi:hypothetical protein